MDIVSIDFRIQKCCDHVHVINVPAVLHRECDTGTSSQRRSDGNIELVRFLDSHEGDGARAVFAGIQLLYKNNFPNDPPSKFAHR